MSRRNCWEFKKCGRQPGGSNVKQFGTCPAAGEQKLDGTHGGENAGRSCWVIAGTFCEGKVQGSFAQKYVSCEKCEFYQLVRQEEGLQFRMSTRLLAVLRGMEPSVQ